MLVCFNRCFTHIILLLDPKGIFHCFNKSSEQGGVLDNFKRNAFFLFKGNANMISLTNFCREQGQKKKKDIACAHTRTHTPSDNLQWVVPLKIKKEMKWARY